MLSRLGASGHVARGHMGRMRSPSSRWSLAVLGLPWPGDTPCSTSNVPFPAAWGLVWQAPWVRASLAAVTTSLSLP